MKTFEWARVRHQYTDGNPIQTLSLLEVLDGGNGRRFWSSIRLSPHIRGTDYEFVAYSKNRVLKTPHPPGAPTVEEAQEAIEQYLMSENVIGIDDEILYLD